MATSGVSEHYGVELLEAQALRGPPMDEVACLAGEALEPNVFYEPWQLLPALELLASRPPLLVTIRDPRGRLCGFFPAHLEKKFLGLPARVLKAWRHEYCFLGTPLLATSDAQAALTALIDWIGSRDAPAHIMEWSNVGVDGECWSLLAPMLQGNPTIGVDIVRHERAMLIPAEQTHAHTSGKRAKQLRNLTHSPSCKTGRRKRRAPLVCRSAKCAPWGFRCRTKVDHGPRMTFRSPSD